MLEGELAVARLAAATALLSPGDDSAWAPAARPSSTPASRPAPRRPVHLELVCQDGGRLPGQARTAPAPAASRSRRLQQRLAAARTGRSQRRERRHGPLLARQARRPTPTPRQRPPLVTRSTSDVAAASTRRCPASAASTGSARGGSARPSIVGNSALRAPRARLSPKQAAATERRRRLEPRRRHPDARHPRRLGSGFINGTGRRSACSAPAAGAAAWRQRGRRPRPGARLTCVASSASPSAAGAGRAFKPTWSERSSAPATRSPIAAASAQSVQLGQQVLEVEWAHEHLHLLAGLAAPASPPSAGPSRARPRCRRGRRGRAPR